MNLDILTAGVGVVSFVICWVIHVITFRWIRPENLLKVLSGGMITMMALPFVLMGIFFELKAVDASWPAWGCATFLAIVIQGLLSAFYILCIFGPYETSVRMRLVREIAAAGPDGIGLSELLQRYNTETIVDIRLQRLIGSGDILEKDGQYQIVHKNNLFFVFDAIAGLLKKWIGP